MILQTGLRLRDRIATGAACLAVGLALAGCGSSLAGEADTLAFEVSALATRVTAVGAMARPAWDGSLDAFDTLADECGGVEQAIAALPSKLARLGDRPEAAAVREAFAEVRKRAQRWSSQCRAIVAARDPLFAARDAREAIDAEMPAVQALLDESSRRLVDAGAKPGQIYQATRQLVLLERLRAGAAKVLVAGPEGISVADRLARDLAMFSQVQDALIAGSATLGIEKVADAEAQAQLTRARDAATGLAPAVDGLIDNALAVFELRETIDQLVAFDGPDLKSALDGLVAALRAID